MWTLHGNKWYLYTLYVTFNNYERIVDLFADQPNITNPGTGEVSVLIKAELHVCQKHLSPRITENKWCCFGQAAPAPLGTAVWCERSTGEERETHKESTALIINRPLSWVWKQKWQQQWAARRTHTHTLTLTWCVSIRARVIIWTNHNCSGSVMSGRC